MSTIFSAVLLPYLSVTEAEKFLIQMTVQDVRMNHIRTKSFVLKLFSC